MPAELRIGSRPSALALAQANQIKAMLERVVVGLKAVIVPISTSGDKMMTPSLARVGGKGLFIRELEQALTRGHIDIAIHSMKDLPAVISPEYRIAAVPCRENSADALITRTGGGWNELSSGASVGTSSIRRQLEAIRFRPDLRLSPLRGNIDTRLKRLDAGDFDAIILALAGLRRLGRCDGIGFVELDQRDFVPSAGQGALAVEAVAGPRIAGSEELEQAVVSINDRRALMEISAERAFLAAIDASCVSPVGVKGTAEADGLKLRALLFGQDGHESLDGEVFEPQAECVSSPQSYDDTIRWAAALGSRLGQQMLERGAAELLSHE